MIATPTTAASSIPSTPRLAPDPAPSGSALSTQHSALPPLPLDRRAALLQDFFNPHADLDAIAESARIPLEQLLDFFEDPQTERLLARLERLAERRARLLAALAKAHAMESLTAILRGHLHDEANVPIASDLKSMTLRKHQRETARRAAATLLRAATPPARPKAAAARTTPPSPAVTTRSSFPVSRSSPQRSSPPGPQRPLSPADLASTAGQGPVAQAPPAPAPSNGVHHAAPPCGVPAAQPPKPAQVAPRTGP